MTHPVIPERPTIPPAIAKARFTMLAARATRLTPGAATPYERFKRLRLATTTRRTPPLKNQRAPELSASKRLGVAAMWTKPKASSSQLATPYRVRVIFLIVPPNNEFD